MPAERSSAAGRHAGAEPDVRPRVSLGNLRSVRRAELGQRFAFGAAISVAAAVLGRAVSARFGGMFLAFPAILPASLTLLQDKEGARTADRDAVGAILGGVALIVFAGVGEGLLPRVPPFLALVASLAAWLGASFALYAALAVLRPSACDRRRD